MRLLHGRWRRFLLSEKRVVQLLLLLLLRQNESLGRDVRDLQRLDGRQHGGVLEGLLAEADFGEKDFAKHFVVLLLLFVGGF